MPKKLKLRYPAPAGMKTAVHSQAASIIRSGNNITITIPENANIAEPIRIAPDGSRSNIQVVAHKGCSARVEVECTSGANTDIQQTGILETQSKIHWINITRGNAVVAHSLVSRAEGDGCESNIDWIFHGKEFGHYVLSACNIFNSRNCSGKIRVRGIVEGDSNARFDGMIEITEEGSGTNAHMNLESMILDKTAKIDAVPALEIRNCDVRASHSASVKNISNEDLFYFASRGMEKKSARNMLIEGFLGELANFTPCNK